MSVSLFLLILLGVPLSKEQTTERFGEIVLTFDFPVPFDRFSKSCCRLFPGECFIVMDNRGFVCPLLQGRATLTERSGSVEFRITNAQFLDRGHYRCYVEGTRYLFKDFYIEISETSLLPPHSLVPAEPSSKSTTSPTLPTGSSLPHFRGSRPVSAWTFNVFLATSLSVATIALIGFVTVVVYCLRKKSKNKGVESPPDSPKLMTADASSIVYTTVNFKPQQPTPVQLYANLERRAPTAQRSKDLRRAPETVEYCMLAPRQ